MRTKITKGIIHKVGAGLAEVRKHRWRFSIGSIIKNLSNIEIDRPIFIVGTQGGGLTLVSRMLQRNCSLVTVTGDCSYWTGHDEMHNVLHSTLPRSLCLAGRDELERFGGTTSWTYASDQLIDAFKEEASSVSAKDSIQFKNAIRRILYIFGAVDKTTRFLDKSQSYILKIPYIEKILAKNQPKFLIISRNPYASCQRAIEKSGVSRLSVTKEEKTKMAVEHWGNSMRYGIESKKDMSNVKTFKIEEIISDTKKVLKDICNYLGLNLKSKMIPSKRDSKPLIGLKDNKWYPLREKINEGYINRLDAKVKKHLNKGYKEEIKALGYEIM